MERLPEDVLIVIFDLLSTSEKVRLSCVCNRLRNVFSSITALHRNVSFKQSWHVPGEAICKYISQNSNIIVRINLQDCYWIKQSQLIKCLIKCCQLTSLNIEGCIISPKNLMDLVKKLTKLQHLRCPLRIDSNTDMSSIFFGTFLKELSSIHIVLNTDHAPSLTALPTLFGIQNVRNVEITIINSNGSVDKEYYKYGRSLSIQQLIPRHSRDLVENKPRPYCLCYFKALKLSQPESYQLLEVHQSICDNDTDYWHNITVIELDELRISGFKYQDEERLSNILSLLFRCPFLRHVSFNNESLPDANLLRCIQSSILETIDLESCYLFHFDVLEEVVERCQSSLKHLNLLIDNVLDYGVFRCRNFKTIRLIAKCSGLQSLALNPCCLRTTVDQENQGADQRNQVEQWLHENEKPEEVQEPISNPLLTLVQSTRFITEFELIEKIRTRETHCYQPNYREVACPCISSEQLESISHWEYLSKLTLAGFQITGSSEFLIKICKSCTKLSKLSLANLKGPALSHSGDIAHLNTALTFCQNLKDFRLEQPYFSITKAFLQALHNMHQLERVCWKVRSGTLAADHVAAWMDECKKVVCVIICCDITKKGSKILEKFLYDRYKTRRASISIHVYPYVLQKFDPLECLATDIPAVHLQNMAFRTSRVAKYW